MIHTYPTQLFTGYRVEQNSSYTFTDYFYTFSPKQFSVFLFPLKKHRTTKYHLRIYTQIKGCFENETYSLLTLTLPKTCILRTASSSYVSENQLRCTPSNYAGVCLQNIYDYSPFGVSLDGRTLEGDFYRYGFQRQEKDDDFKGKGNSLNFEFRIYDPRVGRFFRVDPLLNQYPHNSPYSFSENVVVNSIELEGLEKIFAYSSKMVNGKYEQKLVAEYEIEGLQVDLRKNVFYNVNSDGTKDIAIITYYSINSDGTNGSSIEFSKYSEVTPEKLKTFFNPVPQKTEQVVTESQSNEKPYIDQMIDEAYNEGEYLRSASYYLNNLDQSLRGNKGLLIVANALGEVNHYTSYVPVLGQTIGPYSGFLSSFMKTVVEIDEGNSNLKKNVTWRIGSLGCGIVSGIITDKIIGNKELLKSGTNGFINEKLSDLEEKKTMDKQD